jgi:hypothetical protein
MFGAASLGAVATGALVCALSGVPTGLWLRNLAAWVVGAILAFGLSRGAVPRAVRVLPWIAAGALAATFLDAGQEGVHRWLGLGPLNINAAMLVLPAALVALAAEPRPVLSVWAPALICLVILVAQPDASQATAFGLTLAILAALRVQGRVAKAALVTCSLVLVALAWLRPDPLAPVPEVEEIVALAAGLSPLLAVLALALLAAVAAVPVLAVRSAAPDIRIAGMALGACLGLWTLTTFLGAFPVPLAGVGLSPVLGAWLGVAVLAGLLRKTA